MCLICLLLYKEEDSSPVSPITERKNIGLFEVPLSVSLLGFGIGTMLANFYMCEVLYFKSSFKHTREECESKRAYVFLVSDILFNRTL